VSTPPPGPPPPYDEWGRITRFLQSARLAFARERSLWTSLELARPEQVIISAPSNPGTYKVRLEQHLAAVQDDETLFASVLIHSYALAESAAADRLGADPRSFAGVEDWGGRLLVSTGQRWTDVKDGLAGAVEVAVIRNAFAHGTRVIDVRAETRLRTVGIVSRPVGSQVTLTYTELREFRLRLLSLLGAGGVGK